MSGVFSVTMFRERGCPPCAVKAAVPIMKRRGFRGHAFPVLLSYEHPAKGVGFPQNLDNRDQNHVCGKTRRRCDYEDKADGYGKPLPGRVLPEGRGICCRRPLPAAVP